MAPSAWSSVAAGDVKHEDFVREVEAKLGAFRSRAVGAFRRNTRTMSAATSARTAT